MVVVEGIFEEGIYFFQDFHGLQALACQVFAVCGSRQESNILLGSKTSSLLLFLKGLKKLYNFVESKNKSIGAKKFKEHVKNPMSPLSLT